MLNRPLGYSDFGGNCLCLIDHWDTLTLAVSLLVLNRPLGYFDFGGNCLCVEPLGYFGSKPTVDALYN